MRRSIRTHRDDKGVVALEMVLAVPVLIGLIFFVVVLGNALSVKTQTMGFARDGAREAALGKPLPVVDGVVFAFASPPCPNPGDSDVFVKVQATMSLDLQTIPFLPVKLLPDELTETVTMRCGG
jgi:Flp pilus assembly protein TadG